MAVRSFPLQGEEGGERGVGSGWWGAGGGERRVGTNTEASEGNEDELMEENIEAVEEIKGEETNEETNNHELGGGKEKGEKDDQDLNKHEWTKEERREN